MPRLDVRLSNEAHAKWLAYCANLGSPPSTVIRRSIEEQMLGKPAPSEIKPSKALDTKGGQKRVKLSVLFTETEREGIRLRAKHHSVTLAGWIVRIVRAALTYAPVFDAEQTEVIQESNYQLSKIGTNINQIARRLNEQQDAQNKAIELAELKAMRREIKAHVNKVETLISTVAERGVLKHG